jgi:hypothetical protein
VVSVVTPFLEVTRGWSQVLRSGSRVSGGSAPGKKRGFEEEATVGRRDELRDISEKA